MPPHCPPYALKLHNAYTTPGTWRVTKAIAWHCIFIPIFAPLTTTRTDLDQMSTRLIAKRIYHAIDGRSKGISSLAIKISVSGIALGIAVIMLSFAIILGFKNEVKQKIHGFTSDVRICNLDYATSYSASPITVDEDLKTSLSSVKGVAHLQSYSIVPGMIKTASDFQGMVLKGIDEDYDTTYLSSSMVKGCLPAHGSNGIAISRALSSKLGIATGEDIYAYFFNKTLKARKLNITGIYQTNINEHDNLFVITDKTVVNKINGWGNGEATGLEISMQPDAARKEVLEGIYTALHSHPGNENLTMETPENIYPDIFSWLDVLDANVTVILILMIGLSAFSIVSGLLIILLEKVNTIGILKALGASNSYVRRVFSGIFTCIVARGVLWGNLIGLGLYAVQRLFHPFRLDPAVYYVDHVPVDIGVWLVLAINVMVIAISFAVFLIPSLMIARVNPTKTMKFD